MLISLALALIAPSPSPIELKILTDKPTYQVGTPIMARVLVKNVSTKPIVFAKPLWDGSPAASIGLELYRNGDSIETESDSSIPSAQVMVSEDVSEDRFVTLKPNESKQIYWKKISAGLDFHGLPSNLKASWEKATRFPLPPAAYSLRVTYWFDGEFLIAQWKQEWNKEIRFMNSDAKHLFHSAINGSWKVSKEVKVTSK